MANEVLKKGGEVGSEVSGETRSSDFEGMRFGVKAWRASASGVREGGSPAVPIVLVHGFAQQASTWDDTARLLADAGAECFGFELAGHGAGACSAGGDPAKRSDFFDLRFQARALLAFCRVVARDAGVAPVLVGYSMGGRVALQAACLAADDLRGGDQFGRISLRSSAAFAPCDRTGRLDVAGVGQRDTAATSAGDAVRMSAAVPFSALVLESAGLGPVDDAAREALRERNFAWAARVRDEGVSAFMDWWAGLPLFESQRNLDDDQRERLRAGRLANDTESLALSFERAGAHAMPSQGESIRALCELAAKGIPVSYLAGELDAKYCKVASTLQSESQGAISCCVVPAAGHSIHLERPEAFGAILEEVVESCTPKPAAP
ncbi:alpha/beta fold hydrolase [uncultured Ellagibacter sp.]|uniref:alpha/beta fold hydrolase n=1 Tax=uncultured Ellagibacter sp. TaxID=2137580 RepID=UPI002621D807|nr:alpha/beta fold hydrolase [uncultured Ellagibacter sp.]